MLIAVDGKTMRGARSGDQAAAHLLAALDHDTGTVLTQRKVPGKSSDIPALRELPASLDLDGSVPTIPDIPTTTPLRVTHPNEKSSVSGPSQWEQP